MWPDNSNTHFFTLIVLRINSHVFFLCFFCDTTALLGEMIPKKCEATRCLVKLTLWQYKGHSEACFFCFFFPLHGSASTCCQMSNEAFLYSITVQELGLMILCETPAVNQCNWTDCAWSEAALIYIWTEPSCFVPVSLSDTTVSESLHRSTFCSAFNTIRLIFSFYRSHCLSNIITVIVQSINTAGNIQILFTFFFLLIIVPQNSVLNFDMIEMPNFFFFLMWVFKFNFHHFETILL